jgi:dihydrofolate synthase/folylpolyglutamate synthase
VTADPLTRIRARGHIGIRLGLARMEALLAQLGQPQASLRGVLVGGTNGKGSVAAMVAAVLRAAGYHTGQSPSPHLHDYRERITLDGEPIASADLQPLLAEVLAASEPGQPEHGPATEFELLTAACYLWAARVGVDVMVMEVGLGGRLDASNTWDPDVAAITNVGLDHREYLGETIAAIASEKAAIIKPGSLAGTGAAGEALAVIAAQADAVGVALASWPPLAVEAMTVDGLRLASTARGALELPLLGRHQAANAGVALGVLDALAAAGVARADDDAVRRGLAATRWPGRLELRQLDGRPVLFDGAHNPDGVESLCATLDELTATLPAGPATVLFGAMADKDVAGMLAALRRSRYLADAQLIATGVPDSERALPAAALADAWLRATGRAALAAVDDPDDALARATAVADGLLIVAGSLYLVGHVRARLLPDEVPGP